MGDRKTRADSVLDQLDEGRQEAVFAFGESHTLAATVKWLADEFSVSLSETALSNWLGKRRADRNFAATLSGIRADADRAQLVNKAFNSSGFTAAASTMISQCIFEELQKPVDKRNEDRIATLMVHALKARDQELKEREQEQSREAKDRDHEIKKKQIAQKDEEIALATKRLNILQENANQAREKLTAVVSKGGITPETLAQIEETLKLL